METIPFFVVLLRCMMYSTYRIINEKFMYVGAVATGVSLNVLHIV